MITELVPVFEAARSAIRERVSKEHLEYEGLFRVLVEELAKKARELGLYGYPSPEYIHEINDGDYQGTLLFLAGSNGYQPSSYFVTKVSYGSCSGCDTLCAIRDESSDYNSPPNESQTEQYFTLCLHMFQEMVMV